MKYSIWSLKFCLTNQMGFVQHNFVLASVTLEHLYRRDPSNSELGSGLMLLFISRFWL